MTGSAHTAGSRRRRVLTGCGCSPRPTPATAQYHPHRLSGRHRVVGPDRGALEPARGGGPGAPRAPDPASPRGSGGSDAPATTSGNDPHRPVHTPDLPLVRDVDGPADGKRDPYRPTAAAAQVPTAQSPPRPHPLRGHGVTD